MDRCARRRRLAAGGDMRRRLRSSSAATSQYHDRYGGPNGTRSGAMERYLAGYARLERNERTMAEAWPRVPSKRDVARVYGTLGGGMVGGFSFLPLSRSRYARELEAVLRVFPREQLHVVASEALFRDPLAVAHALTDRLGLPRAALTQKHVDAAGKREAGCSVGELMDRDEADLLRAFLRERGDLNLTGIGFGLAWE